jgi:hypothetical protein
MERLPDQITEQGGGQCKNCCGHDKEWCNDTLKAQNKRPAVFPKAEIVQQKSVSAKDHDQGREDKPIAGAKPSIDHDAENLFFICKFQIVSKIYLMSAIFMF